MRNGKMESWRGADQCSLQRRETLSPSSSSCCSSLGIPHSPMRAMEFLSRSWSPSAYNFQQMFPSTADMFPSHEEKLDDFSFEGPGEKLETQTIHEMPQASSSSSRSTYISSTSRADNTWVNTKGWLGGKSLSNLLRRSRSKKKEDARLQTASIHAALSVTRLAAALASVAAAKSSIDLEAESAEDSVQSRNNMDDIFASAAALVTTVCAEAAESLGAQTIDVSSAINSGWATQTTCDMITLTADAATCLRGVAALKARAMACAYFPRFQSFLQVKAELSVVTPSGSKTHGWASIYSKHSQLILSIRKKHLGFLASTKEYKILHLEEERDAERNLSISLRSNSGYIKLLFKDENQSLVWTASISNLLQLHY